MFVRYSVKCSNRVKRFSRVDNTATVCEGSEETKGETEAVEEGWWTAKDVVKCKRHTVADKARVVHEVAGLLLASWARSEN